MKNQPVLPELKNPFWVEEIYNGDADLGEENIVGYFRTYNVDNQIYITRDDNSEQSEELIATMTVDYYRENN